MGFAHHIPLWWAKPTLHLAMRPPQNQADVVELSRRVEGLFAAAFSVTHDLGVPELAYVADAFDPAHGGAVGQASRVICEACRRAAATGRPYDQLLERPTLPTLVVAAVPFAADGHVGAAFGVIFYCADDGDRRRRLGTLAALAG